MTEARSGPLGVIVTGPAGRMGRRIVERIQAAEELELVGTVGRGESLEAVLARTQAAVLVDVAGPSTAHQFAASALRAGVRPVVGSSGLDAADVQQLNELAESLGSGGVWIPNFSLAAVLLQRCAESLAPWFPDVEIVETHHAGKLDAPSGTALNTAERISRARRGLPRAKPGGDASRGRIHAGIPVHALRLPGVVAEQEVRFGGEGEWLSLRHVTTDRDSFMPGVLLAVRAVGGVTGFQVGLEAVLPVANGS